MKRELERYELAVSYLPARLRHTALRLTPEQKAAAEEVRLRSGKPMTVLLPQGELSLDAVAEPGDLEVLCELASDFSRYAAMETIREGYLPVRGGFRVGLCGTAVMKDGVCTNLSEITSAVIRISREQIGIADKLAPQLFQDGRFQNTLLLSPPGGGKTTLLRDLIRCLSDGTADLKPLRVSLIDERGEIGVCYQGVPQLQIGAHTDILDACPKSLGISMVLRAMNPQIIAVDEITLPADVQAMCMAAGCGVGLLATIHAADVNELSQRPLYRSLLDTAVFQRAVCISGSGENRSYQVEELQC